VRPVGTCAQKSVQRISSPPPSDLPASRPQLDAMASDEQPSKAAKVAPIGPVSGTVVPRFAGAPSRGPFQHRFPALTLPTLCSLSQAAPPSVACQSCVR
jgi:hypothetical protein